MIADHSSILGVRPRIQAHVAPWYRWAGERRATRRIPSGRTERSVGAAINKLFHTHWVVVLFLAAMGFMLHFGS